MRAVKFTENGIEVLELPQPDGEGVRIRPRAVGICGSDLKLMQLGPLPHILGHEIAGHLEDGTPVAVEPITGCGVCDRCGAGHQSQCRELTSRIYGVTLDGGMAEELVVDPRCVVPLAATVEVADAALVEPLAVAVHACVRARLEGGERVAVIGAGAVGLCCVAAIQRAGCDVDLFARHDRQKAAGERLGAGLAPGRDYDAVFDAAGTESSLREAARAVRPGGRIVLVASYFADLSIPGLSLTTREVDLVPAMMYGTHAGGREIDAAAALLAARPELSAAIITHRFPLDAAAEAFRTASNRSAGAIKVVVEA